MGDFSACSEPVFNFFQWVVAGAAGYAACHLKTSRSKASKVSLEDLECERALPAAIFEQAIEHAASGLAICDAQQPDLPIVYASPGFESLTGYSAKEVLGKSCRFMQRGDREQVGLVDVRAAISQGAGCKVLLRNYHKSGRPFWNELTLSPIRDELGAVTHYVGTQVDISHYLETFKALQESELRYQHLYEETPAMLHSIDSEGRIVSVSHHWLEKLGYERQEVIGQPLATFLTDASNGKMVKVRSRMQPDEIYRDLPCRLVKKDGEYLDALLSTVAESSVTEESPVSALGVLVDITERKKAKEKLRRSEALLRAINDLLPAGIFVMDCHSSEALFINSEFYRIWQLESSPSSTAKEQIDGEKLLSECLSHVDLNAFVAASTQEDFTGGNKIIEDEVPLLDGRTLRRIYGPIQENDATFAYLYVFEDITERKQSVQRLAEASQAAEAASRAKSEFLANMSHELRSPLNAILGFTHILKEADPKPEQAENLEIIYRSGEHLLALINDVLDISKIEAGRVEVRQSEFDLYRLLDELQQMFYPAAQEKGLSLVVKRSPLLPRIILSDRLKLRQILINLLSNAVKFTAMGSITLSAEAVREETSDPTHLLEAQSFVFSVADTGTGIEPSDQTRLFDAFVQTESGLAAHQGTGLGLAISAEYANLLGGQIEVTSTFGKGSTFSLSLTAARASASVAAAEAQPCTTRKIVGLASGQPAYRILVVDDVLLNRKLLCQLLTNVGFDVQSAEDGQSAIAQWQDWRPHLIWMDMRMPGISGAEATRQIKALELAQQADEQKTPEQRTAEQKIDAQETVILALTASAFEENKADAIASGCDDFVSKPIQAAEIFEKMAQHLGVRYQYDATDRRPAPLPPQAADKSATSRLTPALLSKTEPTWRCALTEAILDLDDEAILRLAAALPEDKGAIAIALRKCVQDLAYKKMLQMLQDAETVSP